MSALPLCFWCGQPRGFNHHTAGLRERRVIDYIPCAACAGKMRAGILLIETVTADGKAPERPPIIAGAIPTGRWMVITRATMERWRDSPQAAGWEQSALDRGRCLMDRAAYESIIGKGADDGRPH
jgi:hypothetical protein